MTVLPNWRRAAFVGSIVFATLVAVSLPAAAQAAEFTFRYFAVITASHPKGAAVVKAFDRIKERTNGRLEIVFTPYGETPYKATDALSVVRDGLTEMTEWIPAYSSGTYPMLGAPGLPFLPVDRPDAAAAYRTADVVWASAAMKAEVDRIVSRHNGMELGSYYYAPMNTYFTTPVDGPEQFRGKKVRIFSPELADLIKALGGSPVNLAAPEVYTALQRGILDGVITSSGGVVGLKWHEQLKSAYVTNMSMIRTNILVNRRALERLPAELRAVLTEEMEQASRRLRDVLTETDRNNFETMRQLGFSIVDAAPPQYHQLRERAKTEVWAPWAKRTGEGAQRMLDDILAAVAAGS